LDLLDNAEDGRFSTAPLDEFIAKHPHHYVAKDYQSGCPSERANQMGELC